PSHIEGLAIHTTSQCQMEVRDLVICIHIKISKDVPRFTVTVMVIMATITLNVSLKILRMIEDTGHLRG
ncbi:MAG: hypothetical protein ACRD38_09275, partial [Nitrososphaerales archaeon]